MKKIIVVVAAVAVLAGVPIESKNVGRPDSWQDYRQTVEPIKTPDFPWQSLYNLYNVGA